VSWSPKIWLTKRWHIEKFTQYHLSKKEIQILNLEKNQKLKLNQTFFKNKIKFELVIVTCNHLIIVTGNA
jgi:hypothetical protein